MHQKKSKISLCIRKIYPVTSDWIDFTDAQADLYKSICAQHIHDECTDADLSLRFTHMFVGTIFVFAASIMIWLVILRCMQHRLCVDVVFFLCKGSIYYLKY